MTVTVATCECGEVFMAVFQLRFIPKAVQYTFTDHGPERHLAAGHEVTFLKTGEYRFHD